MEVHNLCIISFPSIQSINKLFFLYSFFQKTMTGVNGNKTRHHFITSSKEEMIEEIHLNPTTTTTSTILSSHNTQCSKIHKKVPNFFFVKSLCKITNLKITVFTSKFQIKNLLF